jgi:putative addiction module killer protein
MIEVRYTQTFAKWLADLKDQRARHQIATRLRRFERENFGDVKPIGNGLSEARIDYGPGYRLYFVKQGNLVVVMLCGGDKSSQKRDIAAAKAMAKEL